LFPEVFLPFLQDSQGLGEKESMTLKIARIANMRQPLPPLEYGGAQRSIAQMTVFQAAICAHDVTLYGPADSTIIEFGAELAQQMALQARPITEENRLEITNSDGRIGHIRFRTTGRNAIGYGHPEQDSYHAELLDLLIQDDHQQPFDIIHSHNKGLTRSLFASSVDPHKILTHCHSTSLGKSARYPVICISNDQAARLRERGCYVYDVMHHGLDPYTHTYCADHAGYLVWVGRFIECKGASQAIEIARQAGKPLLLAGTTHGSDTVSLEYFKNSIAPLIHVNDTNFPDRMHGASADEVRREIETLGGTTENPVIFVGGVDDEQKQMLYGNAEATLFPVTWREPFGRVMIESMACGTPVIGYVQVGDITCGAVEEVIEDGITGFHVRGQEEEALAQAVLAVGRLPELDRRKVRTVFERDWSSDRLARQLDAAYRRRLSEPRKPPGLRRAGAWSVLKRKLRQHFQSV
jgi:glycosyltransferase involved in cell wall biosynthesis